jgi:hypothetical protein
MLMKSSVAWIVGVALVPAPVMPLEVTTAGSLPGCGSLGALLLHRAGVTPTSLAAVGASDEATAVIANLALVTCESQSFEVTRELAQRQELAATVQLLESRVRAGASSPAEREHLAASRSAMRAVRFSEASRESTLQSAALSVLSTEQREMLANVRQAMQMDGPVQFKVTGRSEHDWIAIRDAGQSPAESGDGSAEIADLLHAARYSGVLGEWRRVLGG